MVLMCPNCGSRRLRRARRRTILERLGRWFGYVAVRCKECDQRFSANLLMPRTWAFAKCPRCYRTDLSTWNPAHYGPNFSTRWRLAFGARRMRCEACRVNFASFRFRERWYRRPAPVAVQMPAPEDDA